jgi:agmatinase
MHSTALLALGCAALVAGHAGHDDQEPISGPLQSLWYNTLPGDGGTQVRVVVSLCSLLAFY